MASGSTQTPLSRKSPEDVHSSWSGAPETVTVIWKVRMEVRFPSVALTVKLKLPAWVGFPLMTVANPDGADMVRPGGRLPAVTANVAVEPAAPALATAIVVE